MRFLGSMEVKQDRGTHCCLHPLTNMLLLTSPAQHAAAYLPCPTHCCLPPLPNMLLLTSPSKYTAAYLPFQTHCCLPPLPNTLLLTSLTQHSAAYLPFQTHCFLPPLPNTAKVAFSMTCSFLFVQYLNTNYDWFVFQERSWFMRR